MNGLDSKLLPGIYLLVLGRQKLPYINMSFAPWFRPFSTTFAGFILLLFLFAFIQSDYPSQTHAQTTNCTPDINRVIQVSPTGQGGTCHDLQAAIDAIPNENPPLVVNTATAYSIELSPGIYRIPAPSNPFSNPSALTISNKNLLIITSSTRNSNDVIIEFAESELNTTAITISNATGKIEHVTIHQNASVNTIQIMDSPGFRVQKSVITNPSTQDTIEITRSKNIHIYQNSLSGGSDDAIAINDSILDIMPSWAVVFVEQNEIYGSRFGVSVYKSAVEITGNFLHDNSWSAISLDNPVHVLVANNTLIDNSETDPDIISALTISSTTDLPDIAVTQNVFTSNGGGVFLQTNSGTLTNLYFYDNNFWENGTDYDGVPDFTGSDGNISSDPLFGPNYCLNDNSPSLLPNHQVTYMGHKGPCTPLEETTTMNFSVRFKYVTENQADQIVKLTLIQDGAVTNSFPEVQIQAVTDGIYVNKTPIVDLPVGLYDIAVKGPAHLTHVFRDIKLANTMANTRDLSLVELIPGDTIASDDVVNIFDYGELVGHFGSRMPTTGSLADIDFDGDVDIFDYTFLVEEFGKRGELLR